MRVVEVPDDARRLANIQASNRLLALLQKHHGTEIVPEPEEEIASEPEVVEVAEPIALTDPASIPCIGMRRVDDERVEEMVSIKTIQKTICRYFGISQIELLSERRERAIVRPRQIAMYLAKTLTLRSLPDIGRRFGGRDHTTVLHAIRKTEERMTLNGDLRELVEQFEQALGGNDGRERSAEIATGGADPCGEDHRLLEGSREVAEGLDRAS